MVTSLTVLTHKPLEKKQFDDAVNLHFSHPADFENLVEFHWAQRYQIPKEIYLFLRSHPPLRDLKIENEFDVLSEDLLEGLALPPARCALTMASLGRYDVMKDIFRYSSSSHKTIAHLVILDAYLLQALDAKIAFPSLVHLDLHLSFGTLYVPFLFTFLGSNPTIERISLSAREANPGTSADAGHPPTLPRLKHFIGDIRHDSPFLPLAFGKRTLETLSLPIALLSARDIQDIPWDGLNVIDILLEDMDAHGALTASIESLGPDRKMAWREVTIRTNVQDLLSDHLGVRDHSNSTNQFIYINDPNDCFQVLHNFLTVLANRVPRLTHLYVSNAFLFVLEAGLQTEQIGDESIRALHDVARCMNAFPSWKEVKISSRWDVKLIRLSRREIGKGRSQNLGALGWLDAFQGCDIELGGWIHRGSGSPGSNETADF
jgi:hypothetical protein